MQIDNIRDKQRYEKKILMQPKLFACILHDGKSLLGKNKNRIKRQLFLVYFIYG